MSSIVTLFFEPLDVLHFREPRPWDAGSHVLSQSAFPSPETMRGAMRGALLTSLGADFQRGDDYFNVKETWAQKILGGRRDAGTLCIRGPVCAQSLALLRNTEPTSERPRPLYVPPMDLVELEAEPESPSDRFHGDKDVEYVQLGLRNLDESAAEIAPRCYHHRGELRKEQQALLPWTEKEIAKGSLSEKYLMTEEAAEKYLAGEGVSEFLLKRNKIYQVESRVGIARDPDSLTVQEGMFYLVRSFRFAPGAGLAMEVETESSGADPSDGRSLREALLKLHGQVIQLGGRGHRARVHVCSEPLFDKALLHPSMPTNAVVGQRMWLVTPLLWPAGRERPQQILTLCTDRAQWIGGFDQANRCPKPLRSALPAGSVLYLEKDAAWDAVCRQLYEGGQPAEKGELSWEESQRLGYGTAFPSVITTTFKGNGI